MKVKAPPRMSSIQWFVSIAAGLAMFLLPQDAQSYFSDVYRQIFVAVVAFGIAACPFASVQAVRADRRGDAVLHVSHSNYVCNPDWNQDL